MSLANTSCRLTCSALLFRFPEKTMPAPVAYQLIRDIRQLDSNPRLNLASFVVSQPGHSLPHGFCSHCAAAEYGLGSARAAESV